VRLVRIFAIPFLHTGNLERQLDKDKVTSKLSGRGYLIFGTRECFAVWLISVLDWLSFMV
jgi:hypothetical protein